MDYIKFGEWYSNVYFSRDGSGWIDEIVAAYFYELTLDNAIDYTEPYIRVVISKISVVNRQRIYTIELTDRLNYMIYDICFTMNGKLLYVIKNGKPATGSVAYITNIINFLSDK